MIDAAPPQVVRGGVAVVAVIGAIGTGLTFLLAPLNENLRYEAGVKIVGEGTAANLFSHRPLAYRMVMDGIFDLARWASAEILGFEFAVRVVLAGLAVGSGVLLWRGLLRHGLHGAGPTGAVVAGALVLLGPISAGEPEWMATLLGTAAIGIALLAAGRPWPYAAAAGIVFVAAAGMKIITVVLVLLGLGVIALLDRRQAVRTAVCFLAAGLLFGLIALIWIPWEIQWLRDIATVQNPAASALPEAPHYFAALVAARPVLLLLPAALVLAGRRERRFVVLAVAVTAAMVLVQGQYFAYHAIPLVVIAAVVAFRALAGRVTAGVGGVVLAVTIAASSLTVASPIWVRSHERWWSSLLAAVAVAALAWAFWVRQRRADLRPPGLLCAAAATLALMYPGATPWAADLLRPREAGGYQPRSTVEMRGHQEWAARRVHQAIGGPGVEVTYLTPGDWTYFLGNPTACHYPSPLFLQRTRKPLRLPTRSYAENAACLSAAGSRWLVIDPSWFRIQPQPPEIKTTLEREWNCAASISVAGLRLCPRRTL